MTLPLIGVCIPYRLGIGIQEYAAQLPSSQSQANSSPIRYYCFIVTNLLLPLNCQFKWGSLLKQGLHSFTFLFT